MCGSRVCTVCRDLVLVCSNCQQSIREYHCGRHAEWKHCYFSFLEIFDEDELSQQLCHLKKLRDSSLPTSNNTKNRRRTLIRQIEKVERQIKGLETNQISVQRDAPKRCRSCFEPCTICDGKCWGFWKDSSESKSEMRMGRRANQTLQAEATFLRRK